MDGTTGIQIKNLGKKFRQGWIFRDITQDFNTGQAIAVLGPNGSGKSTFLKIVAGMAFPSIGEINYLYKGITLQEEEQYKQVTMTAPYLELPEELTLQQLIRVHFGFRSCVRDCHYSEVMDIMGLSHAGQKPISHFSSGMKQRVRIGLALLTKAAFVFLDEPLSNLDKDGIKWYGDMIASYTGERLVFVASNREDEYAFCHASINIAAYRPLVRKPDSLHGL